ncbi:hypothetical protein K3181_03225 [Qipengyuania sp. YG27]|uniref:Uncharacterized protein n=1 Tax=Qipengyuania mesophila TaxID=2867246 RepID=A0ABS7JS75_9SPHN|nr:hypothetical protein [Qipengyuania mesophila]MBX7500457.1 hypothetical protein [Qipengyuania mesophila]
MSEQSEEGEPEDFKAFDKLSGCGFDFSWGMPASGSRSSCAHDAAGEPMK